MNTRWSAIGMALALGGMQAAGAVLWSDLGATLAHDTGEGVDILGGAVRMDDSATNTLFFKFHVDPRSDVSTEEYSAGFQLCEGVTNRLGVGNSLSAWAYSAFNTDATGKANKVFGDIDLNSARPEAASSPGVMLPYELPRRGYERTIVFKVQYVSGGHDLVTVWLDPDLRPGATEETQPENLTTRFSADASFDQIRLRHSGGGDGWVFSDLAIATSFADFVNSPSAGQAGTKGAASGPAGFTFRVWQREQGLLQNSVHALARTEDGYLWVGGDEGVARFDGVRFEPFGLREGLRGDRVRVLCATSDGALWIGTAGGELSRYHHGRFTALTGRDGLPGGAITALAQDGSGRLWVGTDSGLVIFNGGRLNPPTHPAALAGKRISALSPDRSGKMWVGVAGAGLFHEQGDDFVRLSAAPVESLLSDPHSILEDHQGRLWLGAGDDYVLCREGTAWLRYRISRHLARPSVTALVEHPDGTVWAGSASEGLVEFKGGKLAAINAANGLSDNLVQALLVDPEGNLWVGTGAGLNRVRRRELLFLSQAEGLGPGPVQGLAEVSPGVVWASKPQDGLYEWEGRGFTRLPGQEHWPETPANALLPTSNGLCWAAGPHGLLSLITSHSGTNLVAAEAITGQDVTTLSADAQGTIWAATRQGQLWRCRSSRWEPQTNLSQARPVNALAASLDGSVWLGTEGGGVLRYRDKVVGRLDKRDGLLSDLVRALFVDATTNLWIGTAGGGLSVWHSGRVFTLTTREGLPGNTVSLVLQDDSGRIWLGSNRGIACLDKEAVDFLLAGEVRVLYPRIYGRAEGLLSEECAGGFSPAGLKTRAGTLWFPTLKGIAVIDPRPPKSDSTHPPVVIEKVLVDGVEVPLPAPTPNRFQSSAPGQAGHVLNAAAEASVSLGELTLAPGRHRLEFRYTGLIFTAPERVRFRYRLEPLDSSWMESGTRRTAYYDYVPPGKYTFAVSACGSEGAWSVVATRLGLILRPHFYQAWWFRGLAALVLLGTVGVGARLVEKRKLHRRLSLLEQERALEHERSRIAQDLHDDLGSTLTRISLLSDLIRSETEVSAPVSAHAAKLSQAAGQTVRALEEIVWALRPGSDSLQGLIDYIAHFASELFEGNQTRCRLDLPHDLPVYTLPPEVRHNVFLVVKEALTNALKHAQAGEVQIEARMKDDQLDLLVRDDGKGFNPAEVPDDGARQGLGNMRRRSEGLDGHLVVQSSPGQGATVRLTLRIPAPRARGL